MMGISIADYLAMAARLQGGVSQAPNTVNRPEPERDLHNQILTYCRARGWPAFHGSMAHRTHRSPGEPDFIIALPLGHTLFVECKRHGGKLTPEQNRMIALLQTLGHHAAVARSLAGFLDILQPVLEQTQKQKYPQQQTDAPQHIA
jgi:hypothetical protein